MDRAAIHTLAALYGSPATDTPGNVTVRCPLAPRTHRSGHDRNPSFSIKVSADAASVARCFACGWAGPVRRAFSEADELLGGALAAALEHIDATDLGGLEAALASLRACRQADPGEERGPDVAPSDIERYVAQCSRMVPRYLVERGVVRADVERWRLGLDAELMRAVFPVWDESGRIVGCDRRTILPDGYPKYHAWPPGFRKGEVFYGEHRLDRTLERVYLVEGPMDVVFASRVLPNVLGMLGAHTGIGPTRMAKLRKWARRITFVFDGDAAGSEAVVGRIDDWGRHHPGLRDHLRAAFSVDVAELPDGADPASLAPEALLDAVRDARYLWA